MIAVEWAKTETGVYPFEVKIEANDRVNLLADIMNKDRCAEFQCQRRESGNEKRDGFYRFDFGYNPFE